MHTLGSIFGLSADYTITWTDQQWIEWVSEYELFNLTKGKAIPVPQRSSFATDKDFNLYKQGIALAYQKYNAGQRYTGIDRNIIPDFSTTNTAVYEDTFINFRGAQSGAKLKSWDGYPPYYPPLQLSAEQVDGKDVYRLAFWNWQNEQPWLDYYSIAYLPKGTKDNTGYWLVPLTNMELGRFLLAFNQAIVGKSTFGTRGVDVAKNITYDEVNKGRDAMFFRNEVVYRVGNTVYDPNYYNTFPGTNTTLPSGITWTGFNNLTSLSGGVWCWKWVDGWNLLWCGVQEYIDKFLKVPYNVRDLVAYGESYENVLKGILLKTNVTEKRDKLKNYLSNVDFLAAPTGKMGFWDKLVGYVPAIMAGLVTVFTAGAGSPLLVAAGGLVAATLAKQGKKQQADALNKLLNQQYNNLDNIDKETVDNADGLTDDKSYLIWLLLGGLGLYLYSRKKRRK